MSSTTVDSYREQIRQGFQDRTLRNPAYSLRAYARDLGIAYSRLHDTIHGRKGLSVKSALKIAQNLNLSHDEAEIFVAKIESEHARSPITRKKAQEKLTNLNTLYGNQVIQENLFRLIKDWHHFALVELSLVEGFQSDYAWISNRLGITLNEAEAAVKRLLELKVLKEEDGKWSPSDDFTFTESTIPSDAVKKSHEQILTKAINALYFQSIEERDFNSFTFSVNTQDIPLAKKFIKDFLVEFDRKFGKNSRRNAVYSLSTQLIRLDAGEKK